MSTGKIVALFVQDTQDNPHPMSELRLVEGSGIVGDKHFGRMSRQVLLMAVDELEGLGYSPGNLREQVTVELPGLQQLSAGTVLQIGEAQVTVEGDCAPCSGMAKMLGEDPKEFVHKTLGRRGMLACVTVSGTVKLGDSVIIVS